MTTQEKIELYDIDCNFIDICLPDYLTDHYNRDNQQLLSIPVYYGMSKEDIVNNLIDQLNSFQSKLHSYPCISDKQIKTSIDSEFRYMDREKIQDCIDCLDCDLDSEDCDVYLYVYLEWSFKQEYTYTIPSFLLPAIINDDPTNLNDDEITILDNFLSDIYRDFKDYNFHFSYSEYHDNFTSSHDVNGIGASDCIDLYVVLMSKKLFSD